MTILLTVGGIAIGSAITERMLQASGHENMAMLVNVTAYVACGCIALNYWWSAVHYVVTTFGVHI